MKQLISILIALALASAAPAAQPYLAATLGEVKTVSTTFTLAAAVRDYVFTGTTATGTLPVVAGNTGVSFTIANRGSGNLTIQRAGSDQLYTSSAVTSITVAAGSSVRIVNDGTYWVVWSGGTTLDGDLTALAALSSTGIVARTTTDTYALRTLTGTANQITVTNGDGVSGNPTLSLPSTLTVPGNISTAAGSNTQFIVNRGGTTDYARFMFQTAGTEMFALGLRGDSGGTGVNNTLTLSGGSAEGFPNLINIAPGSPYTIYVQSGARLALLGQFSLGAAGTTKTIATGAITVTKSYHTVDTEAAAATDDLDTINGGSEGVTLVLRAANSARTVVVKDGTGNLRLAGDCSLDNAEDTITLIFDGTNWLEVARSNNGT